MISIWLGHSVALRTAACNCSLAVLTSELAARLATTFSRSFSFASLTCSVLHSSSLAFRMQRFSSSTKLDLLLCISPNMASSRRSRSRYSAATRRSGKSLVTHDHIQPCLLGRYRMRITVRAFERCDAKLGTSSCIPRLDQIACDAL